MGLLVAQTLMVGGIVGALSLRHAEEPVEAMAVQLTSEVCTRVEVRLETILQAPLLLNDLNADAVRGAGLDPEGPTAPFEALFARQLQRFPVSLTYMGTPSGAYVGARRVDDQTITISLSSADTDFRNVRWATNAEGHRTDVLLRSEERYDARTRPWFTAASDTAEARWTDIYMDFTSGALAITASRRLGGTRASAGAVLATDLLLDDLGRFPGDLDLGRGGLVYIVDREGFLVSSSTDSPLFRVEDSGAGTRLRATGSPSPLIRRAAGALAGGSSTDGPMLTLHSGDETYYLAERRYLDPAGLDWTIVVALPRADLTGPIDASLRSTVLVCLLAILLAALLGSAVARRLTRRLSALTREMEAVGQFELSSRPERVERVFELAVIQDALDRMKGGLRSFRRYVPVELVRRLLVERVEARLGGEPRELTIVFSDIAGFTPMVEAHPPELVVSTLGAYLAEMNAAINTWDGTVCQYLGDGILALWGAPVAQEDHAARACRGALAMRARARALVAEATERGVPPCPPGLGSTRASWWSATSAPRTASTTAQWGTL